MLNKQSNLDYVEKIFDLSAEQQEKIFNYKKITVAQMFITLTLLGCLMMPVIYLCISGFFHLAHIPTGIFLAMPAVLIIDIIGLELLPDEDYFFKNENTAGFDLNDHYHKTLTYRIYEKLDNYGIFTKLNSPYDYQIMTFYKIAYLRGKTLKVKKIIRSSAKLKKIVKLINQTNANYVSKEQLDELNNIYQLELGKLADNLYNLVKPDFQIVRERTYKYHIYDILPDNAKKAAIQNNLQNKIDQLVNN